MFERWKQKRKDKRELQKYLARMEIENPSVSLPEEKIIERE